MNTLEQAVFDLIQHNMKEPSGYDSLDTWVTWYERQQALIQAVKTAELATYPSKIGDEF